MRPSMFAGATAFGSIAPAAFRRRIASRSPCSIATASGVLPVSSSASRSAELDQEVCHIVLRSLWPQPIGRSKGEMQRSLPLFEA